MNEKKILVIDDEIQVVRIIINSFEEIEANHTFYRASDGLEGLNIARAKIPDIILTDWDMPRMNGIELIKNLKTDRTTKSIPIIMITGIMKNSENLKTSFETGAIDFIRKPIDKLELIARVNSMLMLSDYYNQIIELKNRELTNTALNIIHYNEFNLEIRNDLVELGLELGSKNKNFDTKINNIKNKLSNKIEKESWQQFNSYYEQSNPDFFKKLISEHKDLTPAELKISALLRLNLNTKDIASLLCLSIDTIKTLRYRLRKKFNLTSEDNLFNFLISI